MADIIRLTPSTLLEQAGELRKCKEDHEEIMRQMTNMMAELGSIWKGSSQEAYLSNFADMGSFFKAFDAMIGDFADRIKSTAEAMDKKDQELGTKFRNLDCGRRGANGKD